MLPHVISETFVVLFGFVQYLYLTHPNVSFLANELSQYMEAPTEIHMKDAKRLLRYLQRTLDHGLHLSRTTDLSLTTFCVSDCARDTQNYKSTATYLIYMGPNAISWFSKKQPTIAKSSMKGEYRTIATTTTELLWL